MRREVSAPPAAASTTTLTSATMIHPAPFQTAAVMHNPANMIANQASG